MKNNFGLDAEYFRKELQHLIDSLDNRTPEELYRYLCCLAKVVEPNDSEAEAK